MGNSNSESMNASCDAALERFEVRQYVPESLKLTQQRDAHHIDLIYSRFIKWSLNKSGKSLSVASSGASRCDGSRLRRMGEVQFESRFLFVHHSKLSSCDLVGRVAFLETSIPMIYR